MLLLTPLLTPLLSGCAGALSALDPAGPAAGHIAALWWAMLTGAAFIFAGVTGLLALALRRRGPAQPPALRRWLVWGGLVFPSLVLTALLGYSALIGERLRPEAAPAALTVDVQAAQWRWAFTHPLPGGRVEHIGTLHIPAGQPVDLRITSADVIHSAWVPRLAGKLDAVPGRVNTLRIQADAAGVYAGQCAEYCGIGHRVMQFSVVAHDAAGWQAFVQGAPP
jgi:cytochrome c oxidase subunit 2